LNTSVAGISQDNLETHRKFAASNDIRFPLLADVEGEVCSKYDVLNFFGLVKRTTYIIELGRYEIIKAYPEVHVDGHVERIIDFLENTSS